MVSAHGFFNSTAFWYCFPSIILILEMACCLFVMFFIFQLVVHTFVGFSYLIASMGIQVLWSFGLACLDFHALRSKTNLHNPVLVSLFVVGDWIMS
ncbi:hypothetical protein CXB51_024958 [Gossypium anomalum]|uniref:CASP-like protein n=1 Tax=Gossypium anomalum TaxID=47600 RepID=A0A8J5YPT3_9ROSI|nr:hypothetical protein CXB51_024958 [Gossypium anomalum]